MSLWHWLEPASQFKPDAIIGFISVKSISPVIYASEDTEKGKTRIGNCAAGILYPKHLVNKNFIPRTNNKINVTSKDK